MPDLHNRDKPSHDGLWLYDPHPADGIDNSTPDERTLLAQLMLLADSGFYFHLSQLVNSPEKYQYMQVLFIRDLFGGVDHAVCNSTLPEQLGLPDLISYIDINEFLSEVRHTPHHHLMVYFEGFQRDPTRSGGFHHDPPTWHAFATTRFLRFLATASSQ